MKIGISSYCFMPEMETGEKTIFDVMDWAKAHQCEHIELIPNFLPLVDEENKKLNLEFIDQVRDYAKKLDLEISSYTVNCNLLDPDPIVRESEFERMQLHVQAGARLGVKWLRHDLVWYLRPFSMNTITNFQKELPEMVTAAERVYDYASQFGITTTLENHGFHCNGRERIQLLFDSLTRSNIKMTLDVGNFACVDEFDTVTSVKECLPRAQIIHMKDFYIRDSSLFDGMEDTLKIQYDHFWKTLHGNHAIAGAITGLGDLPTEDVVKSIKESDFDGYISIEFEGFESCDKGTERSLKVLRTFLNR